MKTALPNEFMTFKSKNGIIEYSSKECNGIYIFDHVFYTFTQGLKNVGKVISI